MEKDKRTKLYFLISIVLVIFSGLMAYGFQTNFGTIDVQEVAITHLDGTKMVGKLYRPIGVSDTNPAPGILGIHGYNNDKDVQRGTALELARAGFVVLTIDQIGHGDSEGALDEAFSTQILGARSAYIWLARQSYVAGGLGVYGHSMGYISAFYFPVFMPLPADVYAPNASIFETFPPALQNFFVHRNVLHIWAEYEEWYTVGLSLVGPNNITAGMTVSEIYEQGLIVAGMNAGLAPGTPGEVDTTYGDFSVGNAYREHYTRGTTHPGLTMDVGVNKESVAWMLQALRGFSETQAWNTVNSLGQTYLYTEIFSGGALFFSFISVMFLAQIFLATKYFADIKQPMPERVVTKKKLNWWLFASINTGVAAVVFILFTHASSFWNFSDNAPILGMGMINNWLGFFLMTAAIALFFIGLWYHLFNKKERGSITPYDLGVSYDSEVDMDYMQSKKSNRGKLTFFVGILVLIFPIVSQIFSAFDNYFAGWGEWLLIPWWGLWLVIGSILVILGIVMLVTKLKENKLWKTLGLIFLIVGAFFDWMTMHVLGYLGWAYWLFYPAFGIMFVGVMLMTNLKKKRHWGIFGKTVLLAGVLFGWMYLLVSIFQGAFLIEFRIFWAFSKLFTLDRFVQFLLYLPIFLPFFLVNGGVLLFGQLRQKEAGSSFKTYFIWWIKLMFATLAGLLVVFLVQYLGVMVSNYPFEGFPNAPIMYLQLMSAIPLFGMLYFIMIFFFRKTGKIYLGSIFGAIVCVWFLAVGTVVGAAL